MGFPTSATAVLILAHSHKQLRRDLVNAIFGNLGTAYAFVPVKYCYQLRGFSLECKFFSPARHKTRVITKLKFLPLGLWKKHARNQTSSCSALAVDKISLFWGRLKHSFFFSMKTLCASGM